MNQLIKVAGTMVKDSERTSRVMSTKQQLLASPRKQSERRMLGSSAREGLAPCKI